MWLRIAIHQRKKQKENNRNNKPFSTLNTSSKLACSSSSTLIFFSFSTSNVSSCEICSSSCGLIESALPVSISLAFCRSISCRNVLTSCKSVSSCFFKPEFASTIPSQSSLPDYGIKIHMVLFMVYMRAYLISNYTV